VTHQRQTFFLPLPSQAHDLFSFGRDHALAFEPAFEFLFYSSEISPFTFSIEAPFFFQICNAFESICTGSPSFSLLTSLG